jgi:dTDP-4-amino-4,6-dideoxygalactose transaminase
VADCVVLGARRGARVFLAPRARFRIYTRASDYLHFLVDTLTGRATTGDDNARLEREIAQRFDVPYALCVPQGRVGIYLAVKALIKPGQHVVLSPYTIADVINMVILAGGVPIFADIDRATTNIRPESVEALIDDRTGAVMVTHLHGMACDIEAIAAICKRKRVPLVEDAAQSFGARVHGKVVGTFGDAGVYSFGMYKNVTAFYGGMVVTPHESVDRAMRSELADKPYLPMSMLMPKVLKALFTDCVTMPPLFKSVIYWIFRFGYLHDVRAINRHVITELDTSRKAALPSIYLRRFLPVQARMVLRQLDRVDRNAQTRIRYARMYHEGLRDLPGLLTPPFRDDGSYVYNYFPVQYRDRAALVRWAMQHRLDMAVQHLKNCASLSSFAPEFRECPDAEATASQVILLPNYPSYREASVRRNIAVIRHFFESGAAARG